MPVGLPTGRPVPRQVELWIKCNMGLKEVINLEQNNRERGGGRREGRGGYFVRPPRVRTRPHCIHSTPLKISANFCPTVEILRPREQNARPHCIHSTPLKISANFCPTMEFYDPASTLLATYALTVNTVPRSKKLQKFCATVENFGRLATPPSGSVPPALQKNYHKGRAQRTDKIERRSRSLLVVVENVCNQTDKIER